MWRWSAPNGATRARASWWTGCRSGPMWWCASRAATMPAIRWSSTGSPTSCRCSLPGIVRPGKLSVIGNGVVIDPWALAAEIEKLSSQGVAVSRDNLRIAGNATLILPLHRELDQMREAAAGAGKIGTTGRGIGPAYEDKVGRRAIRVNDLNDLVDARPQDRPAACPSQCAAPRAWPAGGQGRRTAGAARRDRTQASSPIPMPSGRCSTKRGARANASCLKARKASCSTSIMAPIPM